MKKVVSVSMEEAARVIVIAMEDGVIQAELHLHGKKDIIHDEI